MKRFVIVFSFLAVVTASCQNKSPRPPGTPNQNIELSTALPTIAGNWRNTNPQGFRGGFYYRNELRLTKSRFEWIQRYSLDPENNKTIFVIRREGTYILQPKQGSPDEFNLLMNKRATAITWLGKNLRLQRDFGFNRCNLPYRKEIDISENGCSFIEDSRNCSVIFDIVKKEDNRIFLGLSSPESIPCAENKRPTSFGEPLSKIP